MVTNGDERPAGRMPGSLPCLGEVGAQAGASGKIWLFPGLGCRYVGMGGDILGHFAPADDLIAQASQWLGYDVVSVCLEGSGRKHVPARQESQVIYLIACAYTAVLRSRGVQPEVVAGHSLGSWAAAAACGAFDAIAGLQLLTRAEELLDAHAEGDDQAMGVIVGLENKELQGLVATESEVWVVNWNSPRQQVIAGRRPGVEAVLQKAHERGVKQAKRLPTNRAMHTPLLEPVVKQLCAEVERFDWRSPQVPFVSTNQARLLRSGDEVRDFLCWGLARPVYWQETILGLRKPRDYSFLEVGSGTVLASMMPFIDPSAAIQTASEFLEQQAVA